MKPEITKDDVRNVSVTDLIRRIEKFVDRLSQSDEAAFNNIKAKLNAGATLTEEERLFIYKLALVLDLLDDDELPQAVRIEKAAKETAEQKYRWMN